jgi:signal peptidase II
MLAYAWIAVAVAAADQGTKAWVEASLELRERIDVLPVFAWVHVQNTGAAFSFLAGGSGWQRWFLAALAVAFSAWLLRELARLTQGERLQAVAFALVLGGALGNLADRLLQGSVTDFVLVHWFDRAYFPAFNVADAAITIGAVLWIGLALLELRGGDTPHGP